MGGIDEDTQPFCLSVYGAGFGQCRRSARARHLSQPRHPLHCRFCRRRRQRYLRAPGGEQVPGEHRRLRHHREQAGRRRTNFLRIRIASAARRLYGTGRRHWADVDCRRDLSQSRLPSDQELHRAQHDRLVPAGAGGAGQPSGQKREGTCGLGEGASRQVELRHVIAGLHHRQRDVKAQDRHARRGDPIQGNQRVRICAWSASSACSPFPTVRRRSRW